MVRRLRQEDILMSFVPKRDTQTLHVLGKGVFGTVFKALMRHKDEIQHVAVKQSHTPLEDDESILREAQFVKRLQDTGFVPRVYGMVPGYDIGLGRGLCLVQALFADGITLRNVAQDFHNLPRNIRRRVAWNLALGLKAIHRRGVLLNDIHPGNVLVDVKCPNRPIQYIDMGVATFGSADIFNLDSAQRCRYLAPEVRAGDKVSAASDVYSLGFTIRCINRGVNDALMTEACEICLNVDPEKRKLDRAILFLKVDNRTAKVEDVITPGWGFRFFGCFSN
ncbi:hypothetical protein ACOMHN_046724 [Nucella lapillus]